VHVVQVRLEKRKLKLMTIPTRLIFPWSMHGVSQTFNVSNLSPYFGPSKSRTIPFQEGDDDEYISTIDTTSTTNGPITRSCAKQISD
jgi:hypothetical protein